MSWKYINPLLAAVIVGLLPRAVEREDPWWWFLMAGFVLGGVATSLVRAWGDRR